MLQTVGNGRPSVDLHPNAVYKWAKGTEPQGPARALLWLLDERPELVQVLKGKRGKLYKL